MPAVEATVMTPPRPRSSIAGQEGAGEGDDGLAVDADHLGLALDRELREAAAKAEAGVVDQQVDLDAELLDLARQLRGLGAEVAGDDVGGRPAATSASASSRSSRRATRTSS